MVILEVIIIIFASSIISVFITTSLLYIISQIFQIEMYTITAFKDKTHDRIRNGAFLNHDANRHDEPPGCYRPASHGQPAGGF